MLFAFLQRANLTPSNTGKIKYTTVRGDPEVERNLQTLRDLVASFRPLKVFNAEEKRKEIATLAEDNFKKLLAENGQELLIREFGLLLLRLKGLNLGDPDIRMRVMNWIKPFEAFAREINLHDEDLDSFWESLHRVETGDATAFKARLSQLIDEAARQKGEKQPEGATPPPRAAGQGH